MSCSSDFTTAFPYISWNSICILYLAWRCCIGAFRMRSSSNIGLATGLTDGMLGHKLCYGPLKQVYLCKGAINERKAGRALYFS